MCGIGGIWLGAGGPIDRAELVGRSLLAALRHRGPDDEGLEVLRVGEDALALGNCRLAIQDLSPAGHQPMPDPETGNWLVFNGEIYNFRELRAELAARGKRFRSSCDTEVLLAAYAQWGVEALRRLRGAFAFALWDAGDRTLLLARDRLGEKPLYYYVGARQLLFASEVRALLASGLVPRRPSLPGLGSYLALGAVQDPLTAVDGVASLLPGHYAAWRDGQLSTHAYWSPDDAAELAPESRSNLVERVRGLLEEAVRLQLVSDAPLGAFLSGGIDSSAIVALAKQVSGVAPRTISVVFPEREFSEAPYSRLVARQFGCEHTEVVLTGDDCLRTIPEALAAMDQPTFDGVNTYVVSKHARQAGLTVALSGLGGDELFGGYNSFRRFARLERLRRLAPGPLGPAVGAGVRLALRDTDRARKLARWFTREDGDVTAYGLLRELFSPRDRLRLLPSLDGRSAPVPEGGPTRSPGDAARRVSTLELTHYMRNVLLRDTDAIGMAHALEIRVPFLDHRLVECLLATPGRLKLNGGGPKPLLVEAVGCLPEPVVRRPKQGFALPFQRWLRGPLRPEVEGLLLERPAGPTMAGLLEPGPAADVWRRFVAGKGSWVRPWSLYVLSHWCRQHLGRAEGGQARP